MPLESLSYIIFANKYVNLQAFTKGGQAKIVDRCQMTVIDSIFI